MEPAPGEVEAVVFLVGDAGNALPGRSPVLDRLRSGVERWSSALGRDSAVAVLYLGDNVYPYGVRDVDSDEFRGDSLRLRSQANVVAGVAARRHLSRGLFIPGNHDWGQGEGPDPAARLQNQEILLDAWAGTEGLPVALAPRGGDPGPVVLDLGNGVRLLLVDTHGWIESRDPTRKDAFVRSMRNAMEAAGEREVVVAAHHPLASGGDHGGPIPIWEWLGVKWLLRKTGSLVQDVNSAPYRELRDRMAGLFRETRRPLVWAGGHDHSLQVIRGAGDEPSWHVVSGAGSKLTDVALVPGMEYGARRPGFVRLTFLRGGGVQLHVFATDEPYGVCDAEDGPLERCMAEGAEAFDVAWAGRLR
jgi:hypothetical protein